MEHEPAKMPADLPSSPIPPRHEDAKPLPDRTAPPHPDDVENWSPERRREIRETERRCKPSASPATPTTS